MPRKYSPSQLKSKLRQLESRQKRAVNQYNQAVRKYNREVQAYNARRRTSLSRLNSELAKLQRSSRSTTVVTTRYSVFRTSVDSLHQAYLVLDQNSDQEFETQFGDLLDLSEQENANSLGVMNALLGEDEVDARPEEDLRMTFITTELMRISPDLDNRWRGALFSLSTQNPDAARHFCTSTREIFTQIFEQKAPDDVVLAIQPNCDRTKDGTVSRRAKISYWLQRKGLVYDEMSEFIDQDVDNIIQLFRVFNDGTHGASGKFSLNQLFAIKTRVEDGIIFLSKIIPTD
jgi:hypothetical protein